MFASHNNLPVYSELISNYLYTYTDQLGRYGICAGNWLYTDVRRCLANQAATEVSHLIQFLYE